MRRLIAAIMIAATAVFVVSTSQGANAADPAAESDFVARINSLRASRGLGAVQQHPVLTAKAQNWAAHMAATGCLCHSNLSEGVTVGWSKLGENVGRGPNVGSLHDAFVNSPAHQANMLDGRFGYIGVGVAYGGGQMWVAEVFMQGSGGGGGGGGGGGSVSSAPSAPRIDPKALLVLQSRGRAIAARPQGGFWVLEGNGNVTAYEGAPNIGHPAFAFDIARDIVSMPDGNGFAVLDGFGAVHRFGSANNYLAGVNSPWFGWDIARSLALAPNGRGYSVLDGFGGIHRFGSAPAVHGTPYWPGWNIARAAAYTPSGGFYVLDGFGKVWATDGAHAYGNPWFGWDIARDISVWPGGHGYAVTDGFGGIHHYGNARSPAPTIYEPLDRWKGITAQNGTYLVVRNDGFIQRV
jgi:hypothetical protein